MTNLPKVYLAGQPNEYENNWKEDFTQLIDNFEKILVISSQPLDLDCIGSGIITKKYLEQLNKEVTLMFPRPFSDSEAEYFSFLPNLNEITKQDTRDALSGDYYDTVIYLDGGNLVQFYDFKNSSLPAPIVNPKLKTIHIDHHHKTSETMAEFEFRDETASSTVEVLLTKVINPDLLDDKLATLAYAALMGDTGNFKWGFGEETLKLAAVLVAKGAKTTELVDKIFFSKSKEYFNKVSYIINNLEYDDELSSIFFCLPKEKKEKDHISEDDYDQLKNAFTSEVAVSIKGYDRGFIINYDQKLDRVNVGARGKNLTNKVRLPEIFLRMGGNGGGHFNAAGMAFKGNFEEVKKQVKDNLRILLSEDRNT